MCVLNMKMESKGRQAFTWHACILRAMRTLMLVLLSLLPGLYAMGQDMEMDTVGPVRYTRSINVALNAFMLHDKALDAWTWTFGREPGAQLRLNDRQAGVIEGSARVNFRSEMLVGREESMGVIAYRVQVLIRPGEARIAVSELTHTGNRNTARGGIHLGLITRAPRPQQRASGLSRANEERLYAELRTAAHERIATLLQAFEARLRSSAEP